MTNNTDSNNSNNPNLATSGNQHTANNAHSNQQTQQTNSGNTNSDTNQTKSKPPTRAELYYLLQLRLALTAELEVGVATDNLGNDNVGAPIPGNVTEYIKRKFSITGHPEFMLFAFRYLVDYKVLRYNRLYNADIEQEFADRMNKGIETYCK